MLHAGLDFVDAGWTSAGRRRRRAGRGRSSSAVQRSHSRNGRQAAARSPGLQTPMPVPMTDRLQDRRAARPVQREEFGLAARSLLPRSSGRRGQRSASGRSRSSSRKARIAAAICAAAACPSPASSAASRVRCSVRTRCPWPAAPARSAARRARSESSRSRRRWRRPAGCRPPRRPRRAPLGWPP